MPHIVIAANEPFIYVDIEKWIPGQARDDGGDILGKTENNSHARLCERNAVKRSNLFGDPRPECNAEPGSLNIL